MCVSPNAKHQLLLPIRRDLTNKWTAPVVSLSLSVFLWSRDWRRVIVWWDLWLVRKQVLSKEGHNNAYQSPIDIYLLAGFIGWYVSIWELITVSVHWCHFGEQRLLWICTISCLRYMSLTQVFHRTRLISRLADTAGRYRPVTDISVSARMFLLNITQK